jgi:hypothetical protein
MIQNEQTQKITNNKLVVSCGVFVLQKGKKHFVEVQIKDKI